MHIDKMNISELKIEEPYKSLFLIHPDVLSDIKKDMKERGFDKNEPITIWVDRKNDDNNIVIDGHTRLKAAEELGIKVVWVEERNFKDDEAALRYAIKKQKHRRNLNEGDILHFVKTFDKLFPTGGDRRSIFGIPNIDPSPISMNKRQAAKYRWEKRQEQAVRDSREITAELLDVSTDKISMCRHVLENCSKRQLDSIYSGEKSLHKMYKASLAARRMEKKRQEEADESYEILKRMSVFKDYPSSNPPKAFIEKSDSIRILIPSLRKEALKMCKMRETIEFFADKDDEIFKIFCEKKPIQEFLGSLFVSDFIAMLKIFGYKIEKPSNIKIIEEKRVVPVKKKRPAPLPHYSAARFNEPGFRSKTEIKRMEDRIERDAKEHMKESGD